MATKIDLTMPKECAQTAITETEESKNLGNVPTRSCTLQECAKIATSMTITEKEERRPTNINKRIIKCSSKSRKKLKNLN